MTEQEILSQISKTVDGEVSLIAHMPASADRSEWCDYIALTVACGENHGLSYYIDYFKDGELEDEEYCEYFSESEAMAEWMAIVARQQQPQ